MMVRLIIAQKGAGVYSGNKKMRGAAAEMCGQRPDEVNLCFCRHRCSCISLISSGIRRKLAGFRRICENACKNN